jgi:predicted nucleotidyltransferase
MKACGIVAEYNPFHNGHAYQISEIKKELDVDVIIAVMSGNFLQRGEPAIVDKWTRTQMALAGGVDLVVELPNVFASQPADFFARGAVQILKQLDVDYISFGVEEGSASDFLKGAKWMVENDEKIGELLKTTAQSNIPYPKQVEEIVRELKPDFPLHIHSPNNQLGFSYAKEIVAQEAEDKIQLFPVLRKGASYHEQEILSLRGIASATAIRRALLNGKSVKPFIPGKSYTYLNEAHSHLVTWEDFFSFLKYQITVQPAESLNKIYQMNEGLENRLKDKILEADSFERFMQKVKTKRYTHTRLQRLMTYVLLQWREEDILSALEAAEAVRLLGFNEAGQRYLSQIKHDLTVPLVSNITQANKESVAFDIRAGEIYQLAHPHSMNKQDFTRKPIKFIDSKGID